jgi:hypothetical protein
MAEREIAQLRREMESEFKETQEVRQMACQSTAVTQRLVRQSLADIAESYRLLIDLDQIILGIRLKYPGPTSHYFNSTHYTPYQEI